MFLFHAVPTDPPVYVLRSWISRHFSAAKESGSSCPLLAKASTPPRQGSFETFFLLILDVVFCHTYQHVLHWCALPRLALESNLAAILYVCHVGFNENSKLFKHEVPSKHELIHGRLSEGLPSARWPTQNCPPVENHWTNVVNKINF